MHMWDPGITWQAANLPSGFVPHGDVTVMGNTFIFMLHVATSLPFSLWRRPAQTWVCVDGNLAPGDRRERKYDFCWVGCGICDHKATSTEVITCPMHEKWQWQVPGQSWTRCVKSGWTSETCTVTWDKSPVGESLAPACSRQYGHCLQGLGQKGAHTFIAKGLVRSPFMPFCWPVL